MNGDLFHQIEYLQQRVDKLQQGISQPAVQLPGSLREVFEELRLALEELNVCQEALRRHNEELTTAWQTIEIERQHYHELCDLVPDGYLVTDTRGTILHANQAAARLLSMSQGRLMGKPLSVFVTKEKRSQLHAHLLVLATTRQQQSWEVQLKPRRGSPLPASLTTMQIRDARGTVHSLRWLIRDLTMQKRAEEELRKASQTLGQQIVERTQLVNANEALQTEIDTLRQAEVQLRESERLAVLGLIAEKVAHEIGNTLNNMSTTVQLQQQYLNTHHSRQDDFLNSTVEDLLTEIQRLSVVVHGWRSIAQYPRFHFQPTNVSSLAAEILATQESRQGLSNTRVVQYCPPNVPLISADKEKLKQALLNVYTNAIAAMPQGGTLTTRVYHTEEQVIVEVGDTGIGIPAGVDIFDLFASTQPGGIGLGLAIAQQIVVAHGGTMTYTSELGKGTVFQMVFPRHS